MTPGTGVERVFEMVRKEFRQIFRDPRLRRLVFVAPVIQLIMFGYAVSTDVRNTATFVVDHDKTQTSWQLIEAFTASGYFRVAGHSDRPADLVRALDRGEAIVGIEIPLGFTADVLSGRGAQVQLLFDGTNSNVATVAKGYAERIIQGFGASFVGGVRPQPIDLRERAWFNPALVSQDYNVPAVVGGIIMIVALLLTSMAIVRERELGTLEQLMVSPLTSGELMAGKTIPFAIIGLIDLALVFAIAFLWFQIPFRGSALLLIVASLLYLLSALGIGLLISTISRTQQEAFMASFLVYMPTILLSGFMFPVSSMPNMFQWLTLLNPMRHYLEIVRTIFLKGAGLEALWVQFLALTVMGAGILMFSAARFQKRVG